MVKNIFVGVSLNVGLAQKYQNVKQKNCLATYNTKSILLA